MALASPGFLPDRPRPAWFGNALATLFIAIIVAGFAGSFRTPPAIDTAIENRTVEPLPPFPESRAALRDFAARFERSFNDRFGLRAALVKFDHWAKAVVFGASPLSKVLIGKSGWLYFRGEEHQGVRQWYHGAAEIPDATIEALRDELLRRQHSSPAAAFPTSSSSSRKNSVYRNFSRTRHASHVHGPRSIAWSQNLPATRSWFFSICTARSGPRRAGDSSIRAPTRTRTLGAMASDIGRSSGSSSRCRD